MGREEMIEDERYSSARRRVVHREAQLVRVSGPRALARLARRVTGLLHVGQPLALILLDLGADAQQVALAVVTVGELVDADDDATAGVDLALEAVGRVGDLADVVAVLDPFVRALENRSVAELVEVFDEGQVALQLKRGVLADGMVGRQARSET